MPYFDINKISEGIKTQIPEVMEDSTIVNNLNITGQVYVGDKPHLRCYKCGTVYHYRIRRNWFLKYGLFFLPVKIYFCGRCVKNRYVLLTDKHEAKYKPV
jgi:hypothetical protein